MEKRTHKHTQNIRTINFSIYIYGAHFSFTLHAREETNEKKKQKQFSIRQPQKDKILRSIHKLIFQKCEKSKTNYHNTQSTIEKVAFLDCQQVVFSQLIENVYMRLVCLDQLYTCLCSHTLNRFHVSQALA